MTDSVVQENINASDIEYIVIQKDGCHIEYNPNTSVMKYRNVIDPKDGGLYYPSGYFDTKRTHINNELSSKAYQQIEKLLLNRELQRELPHLPFGATINAYMRLQTKVSPQTLYYTDTFVDESRFQIVSTETAPEFLTLFQILKQCCTFPEWQPNPLNETKPKETTWMRIVSWFRKSK